jgi:hypothetical protein
VTPLWGALLTAILVFVIAVALCGVRPLWIDEIVQLKAARETSVTGMIADLPQIPGAVPLAYFVQHALFAAFGYSVFLARLPSAVCGAAAVFVVALLATELGLRRGWLSAAILGIFPLTLRYSAESRVYAQALFLSVLATYLYVRLSKRPTWRMATAYSLILTAVAYTQPYAASVGVAHILWSVSLRDRATALRGTAAVALTALLFLPWYAWSRGGWSASVVGAGFHFFASARTPLMIFRELAGAGYWGSLLLLCLCGKAAWHQLPRSQANRLLGLLIAIPITLALGADAWCGYFIAVRQFLWVLPSVAILAAAAIEWRTRSAIGLAVLLAGVCIWQNTRFFSAPAEDWDAAAASLAIETRRGTCLLVSPPDQAYLYEFFRPELRMPACSGPRMVLAVTPYATKEQSQAADAELIRAGYEKDQEHVIGESRITRFHRNAREFLGPAAPTR